jgi:hypothetical protein
MFLIALSGCQRSAATGDDAAVETEVVSPAAVPAQRTVRVRNPETGRIETRPVRVKATPDEATAAVEEAVPAASPARYTTQRVRDPQTGRIETKRVPVTDRYRLSWPLNYSVQTAYIPLSSLIYTQLGLDMLDNPQGEGKLRPEVDYMSAVLKARSAMGVVFEVTLLSDSPETCTATITTSSQTLPKDFLKTHTEFLKEQINQALGQPSDDSSPAKYPKMMIVDQPTDVVAGKISAWGRNQGFRGSGGGSDQYYKHLSYSSSSNIEFGFSMRLIDTNKTKLNIYVSNHQGKDEFPMILKSLEEVLAGLGEEPPAAADAAAPQ